MMKNIQGVVIKIMKFMLIFQCLYPYLFISVFQYHDLDQTLKLLHLTFSDTSHNKVIRYILQFQHFYSFELMCQTQAFGTHISQI